MAKEQGWIKLHRKIMDSDGYFDEPFTRTQAWIDMLLLANHSKNTFRKRGILVTVQRGQIGMTPESLGERWQWSRGKVLRFLKDLTEKQQIVQQNTNVTSLISIINYAKYQPDGTMDGTPNGTAESQKTVQQTTKNGTAENGDKTGKTGQQISSTNDELSSDYIIDDYEDGTPNGTAESQKTVQQTTKNSTAESSKTDTNKNDSNKNKEEDINRGGGDLPSPHAPQSGLRVLPNGEAFIEPLVFFTKEQFNGLPKENNDAIRRFLHVTKSINKEPEEIAELWEVFKVQELTFQKPYRNKEDVYRHFLNWTKKQTFRKGAMTRTPKQKPTKNEKAIGVEWMNNFTQCRMSDDSLVDLDANQQDSAKYNLISPSAIKR